MLPRLDAAVAPVTPGGSGVPIADGRQAAFQRALQGLVGQTVTAEVMSKLKDGSYLVKVADNAVRMMLPGDTAVGSNVPLTVLSAQPRPTFQLGNNIPGAAPTLVYSEGGEAPPSSGLPSQDPNVVVPGRQPPAPGNAPAQAGQPGTPAGTASADGKPAPGQPPAGAATPGGAPAAAAGGATTGTAPALPAGAAQGAEPAQTAPGGRPGAAAPATTTPGGATPNPAATLAGQPAAGAAAGPAPGAGAPPNGAAAPADAARPQSLAATLLGKAPLTPSAELPELSPNTPAATLSSAARVLTTLLSAAQSGQTALIGKTALFSDGAPDTGKLAQTLQDTISKSGLFYESHVAEWARGERSLPELMREPQMQRLLQQQHAADTPARAAANGPDLSAAHMVNQQLHTQEQGRVLWQGQAWPGQQMQWEVRRDEREGGGRGDGGDSEPEPVWRSGVRFRLPMLGSVAAAITVIGEHVHIQVQTGSDDTAVTLRAYASRLEGAMAAAGAQLGSLTIAQETPEAGHDR